MNKYRTLLLNIGLFGINTVATKLITFLLVPLYTYYLSTKEFGITDMSLTVISLVLPIASMSISDAVLRFVIDDSNDQKKNDRSSDRISCFFWFLFSDVMLDYK